MMTAYHQLRLEAIYKENDWQWKPVYSGWEERLSCFQHPASSPRDCLLRLGRESRGDEAGCWKHESLFAKRKTNYRADVSSWNNFDCLQSLLHRIY